MLPDGLLPPCRKRKAPPFDMVRRVRGVEPQISGVISLPVIPFRPIEFGFHNHGAPKSNWALN